MSIQPNIASPMAALAQNCRKMARGFLMALAESRQRAAAREIAFYCSLLEPRPSYRPDGDRGSYGPAVAGKPQAVASSPTIFDMPDPTTMTIDHRAA